MKVVTDYAYALDVLDKYDHQILEIEATSLRELFQITYPAAMEAVKDGGQFDQPEELNDRLRSDEQRMIADLCGTVGRPAAVR